MNIAQAPIPENEAEQKAALERVRSTLLTARSPGGGPARRATTRRDRRDVRATTYNPKPSDDARPMSTFGTPQLNTDLSSSVSSQGIPTPTSAGFTGMPGLGDHRTQSMMSMSSSHMGAMAAHANPFENAGASAPGMRASITETVNVLFQGREPARIMVVGEVSISAREVISNSPLHLRLDAFEQLEKAAPNPAYLQPIADRPGEYKLDVAALLATGGATIAPGAGGQAVVLKYQLHVSESRKREYIPLDVHAQWRCEPTQTSFLLTYSANSGCRLGTSTTASTPAVQDLSFLVGIQPGTVGNVQSKPTGVWSAEKRKMYWRIPEEVPFASSTADAPTTHKLLARFAVDAESAPQPVLVRWRVPGQTVSALGLSVVADSATAPSPLNFDEIARQCISGKYLCSP